MRHQEHDTPPSSISGDEITGMDNEIIYLDEVDELEFGDEDMDEYDYQDYGRERTPVEDHAVLVFNKHAGSVYCCDLHPDGKIAVTGGEDDKAYVWSKDTGEVILECDDLKDSVIFVGFSFDGTYLATVDMSGVIKVRKCEEGNSWPIVFEYEMGDVSFGFWHFGAKVLICGAAGGEIYIFKIPSGETKVLQGHNVKVECGKIFHDGVRLAAGYEDGVVKIWDMKTSTVLHQVPAGLHSIRVNAVDIYPDDSLVASISTDGKVIFTTTNNGKVVGQMDTEQNLEALAFARDQLVGNLALGTLKGSISILDVARQMIRHHWTKPEDDDIGGVIKMLWINHHLVTGCFDGSIRVQEGRTGEQCLSMTGHRTEILDFCYNAKENIILTASDDGTARIFKYDVNKDKF